MLYVPGTQYDWIIKAPKYGADALILDLEDSVPLDAKPRAREVVKAALESLRDTKPAVFIRVNPWGSGLLLQDVMAVLAAGIEGIVLPKVNDEADVSALDAVLTELELERGLEAGKTEIVPLCETPLAMLRHYEICAASDRVRRSAGGGGATPGGDLTRALGLQLRGHEGDEVWFVNGRRILEARAAGVTQLYGVVTNVIDDPALVRRLAERSKAMGASGAPAIHPSHVAILNEVFTPSQEEIKQAIEILDVMGRAEQSGRGAARFKGQMVDYAHVRTSLELLAEARELGIDVGVPGSDGVFLGAKRSADSQPA